MRQVLEFPPRDYCKTRVSLESRQGMNFDPSANLFITMPNVVKDLLIVIAY